MIWKAHVKNFDSFLRFLGLSGGSIRKWSHVRAMKHIMPDCQDLSEYLSHLGYIILLIPWDIPHHFRKCPSKQKISAKLQNHLMDTWWWNLDRTLIYRGVNDLTFMLIILFVYCTLGQSHFLFCHLKTLNHCGNYLPIC